LNWFEGFEGFGFYLLTYIAPRPHSKMALSKRFETYGSNPAAKAPPKRRHFAVWTEVSETRPFQPAQSRYPSSQKTQDC